MAVGHLDMVASNGVSDGDGGLRDCLILRLQVGADGVLQGGIVGGGQGLNGVDTLAVAEGEAGVSAANVGKQVDVCHGCL